MTQAVLRVDSLLLDKREASKWSNAHKLLARLEGRGIENRVTAGLRQYLEGNTAPTARINFPRINGQLVSGDVPCDVVMRIEVGGRVSSRTCGVRVEVVSEFRKMTCVKIQGLGVLHVDNGRLTPLPVTMAPL